MSLKSLIKKMNTLAKTNKAELAMVVSMRGTLAERIFEHGKAADGVPLGNYSKGYMTLRKKAGYSSDKKIILQGIDQEPKGTRSNPIKRGTANYSASKQMALDWSVINASNKLGLGFTNEFNADKSHWVEDTYSKPIFESTEDEKKLATIIYQDNVNKILNG